MIGFCSYQPVVKARLSDCLYSSGLSLSLFSTQKVAAPRRLRLKLIHIFHFFQVNANWHDRLFEFYDLLPTLLNFIGKYVNLSFKVLWYSYVSPNLYECLQSIPARLCAVHVAADKTATLLNIPHIPENSISFHRDGIAELYRVNSQWDLDK